MRPSRSDIVLCDIRTQYWTLVQLSGAPADHYYPGTARQEAAQRKARIRGTALRGPRRQDPGARLLQRDLADLDLERREQAALDTDEQRQGRGELRAPRELPVDRRDRLGGEEAQCLGRARGQRPRDDRRGLVPARAAPDDDGNAHWVPRV